MTSLIRILFLSLLISAPLLAQEAPPTAPISLAELAGKADLIMLAQVKDTDYFYRHDYPVSGSAYLKPLIHYKGGKPADIVEVYEKGLHVNECYFPNPSVFEEGRRYLLFLRQDPDQPERYRGLAEGCALDVLVDKTIAMFCATRHQASACQIPWRRWPLTWFLVTPTPSKMKRA